MTGFSQTQTAVLSGYPMFFIRFCPLFQQKNHDFVRFSNDKSMFLSAFTIRENFLVFSARVAFFPFIFMLGAFAWGCYHAFNEP
jgi:hypothetical protein